MKVFVAGHRGMVGRAICRELGYKGPDVELIIASRSELNLLDQKGVWEFFVKHEPDHVYLAAAEVGGIQDHLNRPVDFLLNNLVIQNNIFSAAYATSVKKLLFLGSACIYPKLAAVPVKEECLLGGYLEPSNKGYAIAKIAGIELCKAFRKQYGCNFISVMPTNLYGPWDTYDEVASHVLPAMIRKFHLAKKEGADSVTLWGSGLPTREFLHSWDLARACVFLMDKYNGEDFLNIGSGKETALWFLAGMIKEVVGFKGGIEWDTTRPDGTPRRLLDSTKIFKLGWRPMMELLPGIEDAYQDYLSRYES